MRKQKSIYILRYIFTPLLLLFLFAIIFKGMTSGTDGLKSFPMPSIDAFAYGVKEGYNTMDFLAAFFFSSIVFQWFRQERRGRVGEKEVVLEFIKAAVVGAILLAFVYGGFAITAAAFSKELAHFPSDQLLGELGRLVLGKSGGFVISMAVLLSCLTTAIALTTISAEFIRNQIFKNRIGYSISLLWVLGVSILVSTLQFSEIVNLLAPVLLVCYPSLLALGLCNVLHQLYGVKAVKTPVYFIIVLFIIGQL